MWNAEFASLANKQSLQMKSQHQAIVFVCLLNQIQQFAQWERCLLSLDGHSWSPLGIEITSPMIHLQGAQRLGSQPPYPTLGSSAPQLGVECKHSPISSRFPQTPPFLCSSKLHLQVPYSWRGSYRGLEWQWHPQVRPLILLVYREHLYTRMSWKTKWEEKFL